VLIPFAPSFNDIYRIGIKEPAESLGIRAERVDEQIYAEGILDPNQASPPLVGAARN